jgi:hypothetical protein
MERHRDYGVPRFGTFTWPHFKQFVPQAARNQQVVHPTGDGTNPEKNSEQSTERTWALTQ